MWGARNLKNESFEHEAIRHVHIAFFSYFNELAPEESLLHSVGCIDTVAGWWMHAGRKPALCFGHAELRFSDNKAISITRGQGVHYEQRVLSKCNYSTHFKIAVTPHVIFLLFAFRANHTHTHIQEEAKMQRYAQEIYEEKPTFNLLGMLWNFAPFTSSACCTLHRQNTYFCTELLVKILQKGGVFLDVDPSTVSPNKLYDMCVQNKRAIITTNKMSSE